MIKGKEKKEHLHWDPYHLHNTVHCF